MRLKSSSIEPTYLAADDELLWGLTVEQTLTYTGMPEHLPLVQRLTNGSLTFELACNTCS